MKRAPYPKAEDLSGKHYWRSLGEFAKSADFERAVEREFPEGAAEPPSGLGRRSFLSVMGASVAMAGLTACRRPEEKILPYARPPEEVIPGKALYFATAIPWLGTALGLLVESHEGRPTKIEGNPRHPDSLGATTAFAQAVVLDLYDPDRSQSPSEAGRARTWDDATQMLRGLGERFRGDRGQGLGILTEPHRSPTLAAGLENLRKLLPKARIWRYDPFSRDATRQGASLAFGRPLEAALELGKADVIVTLDNDLLATEGSPVKQARGFSEGRDVEKVRGRVSRLYAIESAYSFTGASADHRLRVASQKIPGFAFAVAAELGQTHRVELHGDLVTAAAAASQSLDERTRRWARAVAKDLFQRKGRSVIVAGRKQPAVVHAVAHAINVALGNAGNTVHYLPVFDEAKEGPESLADLAKAIRDGSIKTLVILGGNPAFDAPADLGFAELLKKLEASVHLSTHADETSALASWHLNRAHDLEGWGDVRAEDGTASVVQPLIAPLYGGKTAAEVIEILSGGDRKAYELVRSTWRDLTPPAFEFEKVWRRALHDGLLPNTALTEVTIKEQAGGIGAAIRALPAPVSGIEVTFEPDPHAWDGRFANNGWLQELPDSMRKLTWGNAAGISPKTAERLGVADGDILAIKISGVEVSIPAVIAPGQADDSIVLTVGQGRTSVGRVGHGIGVNTYPLRRTSGFEIATAAEVRKTGDKGELFRTQEHFMMEKRPLAREGTVAEYARDPEFAKKKVHHLPLVELWDPHKYEGHAWGMTIDLNTCISCSACVIACQSENNIPVVGKEGVKLSREMHWLRIDRYFEGDDLNEPAAVAQPMPCQHCENAPCEEVCPVAATTHSHEGLNEMTYNRCIGTKYCGNNCPFKVRHFNYFDYTKEIPEQHKAQFNPDVTIRSRGVMEKCTFCVQRINHAKIDAKREGRERIHDGEVTPACAQACPTHAISFGDLNDRGSEVAKLASRPRAYHLLAELDIKPRVSYLARIRNPNPELEGA
jgi:molybdopterin-containing oxidoreductase family iron-sulfur binding subunit